MAKTKSSTKKFEAAAKKSDVQNYVLRLYIAGTTPGSTRAVETLREICDEHLDGRCDVEVIDVYQQPVLARDEQIIAVPTLVKKLPAPLRKIIGDFANKERVLIGMDLKPKSDEKKPSKKAAAEKK